MVRRPIQNNRNNLYVWRIYLFIESNLIPNWIYKKENKKNKQCIFNSDSGPQIKLKKKLENINGDVRLSSSIHQQFDKLCIIEWRFKFHSSWFNLVVFFSFLFLKLIFDFVQGYWFYLLFFIASTLKRKEKEKNNVKI